MPQLDSHYGHLELRRLLRLLYGALWLPIVLPDEPQHLHNVPARDVRGIECRNRLPALPSWGDHHLPAEQHVIQRVCTNHELAHDRANVRSGQPYAGFYDSQPDRTADCWSK